MYQSILKGLAVVPVLFAIEPQDVVMDTPTVVTEIHGKDFVVAVAQSSATRVAVLEGIVQVEPLGGRPSLAPRGQIAAIAPAAGSAAVEDRVNVPSDAGLGALGEEESKANIDSESGDIGHYADSSDTESASDQLPRRQPSVPTLPPVAPNVRLPQPSPPSFSPSTLSQSPTMGPGPLPAPVSPTTPQPSPVMQ